MLKDMQGFTGSWLTHAKVQVSQISRYCNSKEGIQTYRLGSCPVGAENFRLVV